MVKTIFYDKFDNAKEFGCSNNAVMYFSDKRTFADYTDFIKDIQSLGYELYAENKESGNCFSTLVKSSEVLNVYYTPCDTTVRMIVEESDSLPPRKQDNTYEKKVTPLVTQLKSSFLTVDCGMCYVIRLCDGRFILIDTAFDEYEEAERLLEVLEEQNTVYEKPVLAACFFTHAHSDHISVFVKLMKEYSDRLIFGDVVFNWPVDDITAHVKHDEFDEFISKTPGVRVITARCGQRFCYADAVIDMLFVCDDLYPEYIKNSNDTSMAFRMEINGRRIMWLGDVQEQATDCICNRYDSSTLNCEFVQVAHHGYWGGSNELYRRIDPEVLLWPVPDFWYHEAVNWNTNEFFLESDNIKKVFISGRYETVLDMTKPVHDVPSVPNFKSGDIVYDEGFSDKKRVIDLNWTCLTGGYTECDKSHLKLTDCGCEWSICSERHSILEILRPEILDDIKSYKLEIDGEFTEKPEEIGIIFNHERPTYWSEEHFVTLPMEGSTFSFTFIIDEKSKTAGFVGNERPYIPENKRGLYFVLKNGIVILNKIKLTKL